MSIIFLGCRKCKRLDVTVDEKKKGKRKHSINNIEKIETDELRPSKEQSNIVDVKKTTMDYSLTKIIDERLPKKSPIIDDYEISNHVLGLGINGKVVQCFDRKTREKYALKVI